MTAHKVCNNCKEVKSLDSFYRYKRQKDGRLNICKRCFLAKQKTYYARNRAEARWLWMR